MATYEILSAFPSGDSRKSLAVQRGFAAFRKLVVARQLLEDVRDDEEAFQAFLHDVKVAAVFSHPNIADVFDLDAQDNQLLLISEFVPGASLAEINQACRRANLKLPLEVTLRMLQHAATGLHYAHNFVDPSGRQVGILHRHLNDEALVVSFDGLTKLTDFCVPAAVGPGAVQDPFAAPEYGWGDQLDARADVYALGVVLQRALQELRQPGGQGAPAKIPQALDAVVQRATARDREQRFSTALEFAKACEQAAGRGWEPAQLAAFIRRLFQDRRARMAELVKLVEVKETTAVMKLSEIFEGGGGAGSQSAISEATQPGLRNPLLFEPEEENATNLVNRPPPTVGIAAEAPVLQRRGPGPRRGSLGGALLRGLLWLLLLGGAFSAGAYVMDPPRATALAQHWLQRGKVLAGMAPAVEGNAVAGGSAPAPALATAGGLDLGDGGTSLEDAGTGMSALPAFDAGASAVAADAGSEDEVEEDEDAGTAQPAAKKKRRRRRR